MSNATTQTATTSLATGEEKPESSAVQTGATCDLPKGGERSDGLIREHGIKFPSGSYHETKKGSMVLVEHQASAELPQGHKFAKAYFRGAVRIVRVDGSVDIYYLAVGDEFSFSSSSGETKKGLFCALAHLPGHPYGIYAVVKEDSHMRRIEPELFVSLTEPSEEPKEDVAMARWNSFVQSEEIVSGEVWLVNPFSTAF